MTIEELKRAMHRKIFRKAVIKNIEKKLEDLKKIRQEEEKRKE